MNEFLQQFVVESRELLNQAVEGLLILEQSPSDAECLDAVFRAFHTLKGGAGIVEFPAMERTMHAAEEGLSEARSGQRRIAATLISSCLASLELVSRWLDAIAERGELPSADREALEMVRRFADATTETTPAAAETADDWVRSLRARHRSSQVPLTAVRYTPSVDCFFQGEDPAARIASLPQLLAQELVPLRAWPSLSELDPYACNLVLIALSAASVESVRAHLQGAHGDCEVLDLRTARDGIEPEDPPAEPWRDLLQSQLRLLTTATSEQFAGRVASAGRVSANVLHALARTEESREVKVATEQSLQAQSADSLLRCLERVLRPPNKDAAVDSVPIARVAETTLRVDTARIDALVRLTGELTTAKNALSYTTARVQHDDRKSISGLLEERVEEFDRLIKRLQHAVLALRVLPLRVVMQRFPKVLRDISSALGKPVTLLIEGDHTEADKTIVDMLFEPLLHALRNAVDHGVESPARRIELKKPLIATIQMRAHRASDRVIVEVEDDGSGVDVDRVRAVALQRGLVTRESLEVMSEPEIIDLIFAPGFSTAETVSELSGRGVGLDVVRTVIQRVGGQLILASRPGLGTTLTFSLPFSVMVTQVLTVEAGGQTFGIPLDALLETLRVPQDRVAGVGAARVITHRNRTLPLIDLASELGQGAGIDNFTLADVTVVLASVSDDIVALRVDQVGERIEVILKPLEGLLAGLKGITGTTVLGNGRVLLVLDVWELLA